MVVFIINLSYVNHVCNFQDPDSKDATDWDRYAAEEYELLVAEEQANEQQDL